MRACSSNGRALKTFWSLHPRSSFRSTSLREAQIRVTSLKTTRSSVRVRPDPFLWVRSSEVERGKHFGRHILAFFYIAHDAQRSELRHDTPDPEGSTPSVGTIPGTAAGAERGLANHVGSVRLRFAPPICRHRLVAKTLARYARYASSTLAGGSISTPCLGDQASDSDSGSQRSTRWRGTTPNLSRPADRAPGSESGTQRSTRWRGANHECLGWRTTAAPSKRGTPGSIPGRGTRRRRGRTDEALVYETRNGGSTPPGDTNTLRGGP